MTGDLRPGDVVSYVPDSRWCKDGIAIAEAQGERIVLADTYWVSGQTVVRPESYEVLFNLNDYERKPQHEWETFAPTDRQAIYKQHGCYPTFFVRKGAVPDLGTQIENARERISDAEAKVRGAQWNLDYARRELAALEAATDRAEAER